MIKTAQIRIIADTQEEAQQAIAALKDAIGMARVAINSPRQGRDKAGDGKPPWLAYGTFQFEAAAPTPQRPVAQPKAATGTTRRPATPKAATGATRRLAKPKAATGPTKRLKSS